MTIEAWNIVLSAVIVALLIVGGFWLRHVVTQQLKSKDATIQALEGVIKLKDVRITTLESDTAPAIAKSYAVMREHANQTAEDYQNVLDEYQELMLKKQLSEDLEPAQKVLRDAHGLILASEILHKHLHPLFFPDGKTLNPMFGGPSRILIEAFLDAGIEISAESVKRSKEAGKLMGKIKRSEVYRLLANQQ
jgi:hypothetical protein